MFCLGKDPFWRTSAFRNKMDAANNMGAQASTRIQPHICGTRIHYWYLDGTQGTITPSGEVKNPARKPVSSGSNASIATTERTKDGMGPMI